MTALLLAASLASATEDSESKLDLLVSLDVTKTPLREVIDQLRDATDLNFVVAKGGDTLVSIKVRELKVRSVLQLLLKPMGLTATWQRGAVVIGHRRCNAVAFSVRIYDVRAATGRLQDFPGSDSTLIPAPMCSMILTVDESRACTLEEDVLVMLIRSHTGDLRAWTGSEGTISIRDGMLVVRQTADVHREIKSLLTKLGL
jgi:hypothetical protein